jgi:Do/DeqQ family serine protease
MQQSMKYKLMSVAFIVSILFWGFQSSLSWAATGDDSPKSVPAVTSYADIVSRVSPAVVTIHSEGHVQAQQPSLFDDPRLRDLFGDRLPQGQQQPRRRSALGSGVIVSADGYILTNYHVIDQAEHVKVELTDNRTFDAKLIGADKASDLAVLKINATALPVLPLGDSDHTRVGDVVLAVGNPLGVGQTVTSGIISAKGRATGLSDGSYEDFIQTDAAINQGNSGGALVNTDGELIGINSQILSPSGGSIGIGFAIPSNMARGVMEQLIKTGRVRRSKLGVGIQPLTSDIAASLGISRASGAIVTSVEAGSPAERAGIRRGDVITAFNGAPVTDTNSLRNQVARTEPGTAATVTIVRDNREQQVRVTVSELVTNEKAATSNDERPVTNGGKLGISVEPLTPEMANKLNLANGSHGLLVTSVDPSGPAADAGLKRGDLIEEVDRKAVNGVSDLNTAIQNAGTRPILLFVNRQGQSAFFTIRLH